MADRYTTEAARYAQEPDESPAAMWRALTSAEQSELLALADGDRRGAALRFGRPARAALAEMELACITRPGRGGRSGACTWHITSEGLAVVRAAWCPVQRDLDPPGFDPTTEGP